MWWCVVVNERSDNYPPQYQIYLVEDIRNVSMGLVPGSYFGCLGPDNHPPQYSIYLVPDIGNVSMGLVPGSYFEYLGPDIQYPIYLVPDIRNGSMGLVPERHLVCKHQKCIPGTSPRHQ